VLGGALFFVIALGLVAFQNMLVTGQGRLDDLHGRIDDATEQHAELELQVATLESPERIVEAATSDLGMVPPPGITYLTPDGLVTVPSPGAATGTDTTTPETTAP
jgi:cell division protein FtsL